MHRAIETRYKGYRFRSRLEARYAVLFNSLGIKWSYEPEGFELAGGGRYLPDFWFEIPGKAGWGYWVEIKANAPTTEEIDKLVSVCKGTEHKGWFFVGTPGDGVALLPPRCQEFPLLWSAPIRMCMTGVFTEGRLSRAINDARSARFEFGESGARA